MLQQDNICRAVVVLRIAFGICVVFSPFALVPSIARAQTLKEVARFA